MELFTFITQNAVFRIAIINVSGVSFSYKFSVLTRVSCLEFNRIQLAVAVTACSIQPAKSTMNFLTLELAREH